MKNIPKSLPEREAFFLRLYRRSFPDVASYIRKRGGSLEDARDIYQDSLLIFYEKLVAGELALQKNERAYLLGTAKYLWFKKYKTGQHYLPFPDETNLKAEEQQPNPVTTGLLPLLEKAGSKCLDILRAFYYDRLNAEELADTFGFSGSRSATVQKYKCLEKVRDRVKEKSLQYEDFLE